MCIIRFNRCLCKYFLLNILTIFGLGRPCIHSRETFQGKEDHKISSLLQEMQALLRRIHSIELCPNHQLSSVLNRNPIPFSYLQPKKRPMTLLHLRIKYSLLRIYSILILMEILLLQIFKFSSGKLLLIIHHTYIVPFYYSDNKFCVNSLL